MLKVEMGIIKIVNLAKFSFNRFTLFAIYDDVLVFYKILF